MISTSLPTVGVVIAMSQLAQFPAPPIDTIAPVAWSLVALLAVVVLILTSVVQYKKAFGRTPSINEVIGGLATLKHVDDSDKRTSDLKEEMHTRSRGLEEQIAGLRHEIRGEYQAAKNALQITREEIAEQLDKVHAKVDTGFKALHEERSRSVGNLHGQLKSTDMKLAAVEKEAATHTRQLDAMDGKMDRMLERMPRKSS